jgi:hypothetical protein
MELMVKRRTRREKQPHAAMTQVRECASEVGLLRLIARTFTTSEGHTSRAWDLHPDDVSKLPPGAVRADMSRQVFGLGGPLIFYIDRTRTCCRCGKEFVFRADEQRYWYETLRFTLDSVAIRCASCRRESRRDRERAARHVDAVAAARAKPNDAGAQLALAESIVAERERERGGDIDAGIAAARRAHRLNPSLVEALYFEAWLHDAAGRPARAREMFAAFLKRAEGVARRDVKTLVRATRKRIDMP